MLVTLMTLDTLGTFMCLNGVLYIPKDGHMSDRNMQVFSVEISVNNSHKHN